MNGSFSQLYGLNSTIASAKQQVGEMGVADDFAERITALETKQKEALDKVTELYLAAEAGDAAGKAEILKWFADPANKRGAR
jgi:hypothetical protein